MSKEVNPLNSDLPSLTGLVTGAPGRIVALASKQTNLPLVMTTLCQPNCD